MHHEVECRGGDDASVAGRIHQHTSLCARFADGRVSRNDTGTRTRPGCHHRFCRLFAAARIRCVGRVHRSDDHPGVPPEPWAGVQDDHPDTGFGTRYQPRIGGDGWNEDCHREQRRARQHRRGGLQGEGGGQCGRTLRCHDNLSLDARRLRKQDTRARGCRTRCGRSGLHGRCQHERTGGPYEPRLHRCRRMPPEPAQDLRHASRWRRSRRRPDMRGGTPCQISPVALGHPDRWRGGHHGRVRIALRQCPAAAHHLRIHQDARSRRTAPVLPRWR